MTTSTPPAYTAALARADRENEAIKAIVREGVDLFREGLADGTDRVALTAATCHSFATRLDKITIATLAAVAIAMLAEADPR